MFTTRLNLKYIKRVKLRFYATKKEKTADSKENTDPPPKCPERSRRMKHQVALAKYLSGSEHLREMKPYIPSKYLKLKRSYTSENFYLIDSQIANKIVKYMIPYIDRKPQVICETGPGLGLITSELLEAKYDLVRLYEPCPEFRETLRDFNKLHPGKVELFVKDVFQLHKMSYLDKIDSGNRVAQMLRGVPKKEWKDDPAITIVGVLPKMHFISYLMKMLALQTEIVTYGRVQLFAIMRPADYIKLTAGPENNLHTYLGWSVLFSLFFDYQLIDKFPKKAFLPWETKEEISKSTRYFKKIDLDQMYFVRINYKKVLPVEKSELLPLYFFVRQFFGRGTNKIIPTVEKWIPGLGKNLIIPKVIHKNYYKNMSIFTKFGELTPLEILSLFKEMISDPSYENSSFAAMVQSELLKTETRDSHDDLIVNSHIAQDLEEKLDL